MENLLMDYVEDPGLAHELSEMVIDYKIRLMKKAIELGADAVVSGDDYAMRTGPIMSPSHFRDFVLPYLKRSIDAAHDMGVPFIKHTDGNIWPILPMMVEAGIDALDPIEPIAGMDIGEVKARYGDRIAVIGNVDCTEVLSRGTKDDVVRAVKETIKKASPGGGHILASSNSIHPAVKPENYKAMLEAGREFGRYPIGDG
jgi:uroporphyrinogen decarboxylase